MTILCPYNKAFIDIFKAISGETDLVTSYFNFLFKDLFLKKKLILFNISYHEIIIKKKEPSTI